MRQLLVLRTPQAARARALHGLGVDIAASSLPCPMKKQLGRSADDGLLPHFHIGRIGRVLGAPHGRIQPQCAALKLAVKRQGVIDLVTLAPRNRGLNSRYALAKYRLCLHSLPRFQGKSPCIRNRIGLRGRSLQQLWRKHRKPQQRQAIGVGVAGQIGRQRRRRFVGDIARSAIAPRLPSR